MSIDVDAETMLQFPAARNEFPGRKTLSLATLHRWRLHGVKGAKLETCLIGGLRYTSREAINRFIAALNAGEQPGAPAISKSQRRRQAETADRLLREAGV